MKNQIERELRLAITRTEAELAAADNNIKDQPDKLGSAHNLLRLYDALDDLGQIIATLLTLRIALEELLEGDTK